MRSLVCGAALVTVLGASLPAVADATAIPADEPTVINGINLACTGVGDEARSDPRWPGFAVRIEFANAAAEYLSDVNVTVADASGKALFQVTCDSPWILADLEPGKYNVTGTYEGVTKSEKITAPKTGQARFVIRFPENRER